jgi:hypothetical protein
MLTIRDAQLVPLRRSALLSFEEEMVGHVKTFAPWHADGGDDEYVCNAVRHARERALRHGFSLRGPIRLYIELTCFLGSGFDTDPQYPWATRILEDQSDDEFLRADRLHASTMSYLDRVAGPHNQRACAALLRMKTMGVDLVTSGSASFHHSVLAGMRNLYPEKCDFIGQAALDELIRRGKRFATTHGAAEPADRGLCIGMKFVLGHGFASDPLLGWARKALADEGVSSAQRFATLRAGIANYLDGISRSSEGN